MNPSKEYLLENKNKSNHFSVGHLIQNLCRLCCMTVTVNLLILFLIFSMMYYYKQDSTNSVYINSGEKATHIVDHRFLSIGLDDIVLATRFKGFNMSSTKLVKMIKHLQPAYLRVGGNLADKLLFSPENTDESVRFYENFYDENTLLVGAPNYTLSGKHWLELLTLASNAKVDVIFDLNALIRFKNGSWDYRNAEELIKFSNTHRLNLNWELGNEPNSFEHKFNESVNPTQLGKDFITLRNILNQYEMYRNSIVVGPDVDRLQSRDSGKYLHSFLKIASNVVDKITWHQYYLNGRTSKPSDFLNPDVLDSLAAQIATVRSILKYLDIEHKPIWLGETSSAFGGGAPNISDRFVASFCWLDKLGLSAKLGLDGIVRQSIVRGNYALLNDKYDPNPDWWVSVLYKLLVGQSVVPSYTTAQKTVRLYTHCTNNISFLDDNTTSSVTIFGVNLDSSSAKVHINGLTHLNETKPIIYAFELTSGSNLDLSSEYIQCNGKLLRLLEDYELPKFLPKIYNGLNSDLIMPPHSLVFWVIPNVNVKACEN